MSFPQKVNDRQWVQDVSARLKTNRRQVRASRYTAPFLSDDRAQWPFYSALHAMVYRWFDGDMAADELRSATAQQAEDGQISRVVRWDEQQLEAPFAPPPLIAVSTVAVYHLTGDWNLIERLYPRLKAMHNWFDRERDADHDGLIEPAALEETLRDNLHFANDDNGAITERDIAELNCLRLADLDALAHVAYDLGLKDEQQSLEARATALREALEAYIQRVETPLALFARCATPDYAKRVASAIESSGPWGPTYDFAASTGVSMIYNWLLYVGLRNHDLRPAANALAERSLRLLEHSDYQAAYDVASGQGLADEPATGAALAIDMLFRERQTIAPGSHCI